MKKLFLLLGLVTTLAVSCKKDDNGDGGGGGTPRTEVPDELVGAWEHGTIDFTFWENYKQGQWAGRNAIPTREAMIFSKNGEAKFYRYEGLFNFYEELIDCTGTVTFNGDGTFTFYPVKGRKRFFDTQHAPNNKDRALTKDELAGPKLGGKRGYVYVANSTPQKIEIKVPTSAPYFWYRK